MSDPAPVDRRYYESITSTGFSERLLVRARQRMYDDLVSAVAPSRHTTILDIGVSDVLGEGANFLEQVYPHPDRITAVGLGEAPEFQAAFPTVSYLRISGGQSMPFDDRAFDVAVSNAVLEHVGGIASQRAFVEEALRVARMVYVTVPNRFFPVEHHTRIPLAHWSDQTFRIACALSGKKAWADPSELRLMSVRRLRATIPAGVRVTIRRTGLPLGPFSSNLSMLITQDD